MYSKNVSDIWYPSDVCYIIFDIQYKYHICICYSKISLHIRKNASDFPFDHFGRFRYQIIFVQITPLVMVKVIN
jgi:hypothetical protein